MAFRWLICGPLPVELMLMANSLRFMARFSIVAGPSRETINGAMIDAFDTATVGDGNFTNDRQEAIDSSKYAAYAAEGP